MKVTIDTRQLDSLRNRFKKAGGQWERELQRAVSNASRATLTEAKREIASEYQVTQRRIAQGLRYERGKSRLGFVIIGRNKPIRLREYGGRATKAGVSIAVRRGKRKVIRSGFAGARARGDQGGGGQELWVRTGEAPRRVKRGRNKGLTKEPIKPLVGPSVANQLGDKRVLGHLERFFQTKLSNDASRRLARLLKRGGA